jgi:hypothetical protein
VAMNDNKAELVTHICKECQKQSLTLGDFQEIIEAVKKFYYQNARP